MANRKYVVELTLEERECLLAKIKKGTLAARANLKARILLKSDRGPHGEGWTDREIWVGLESSASTVARVRETFVMEGLEAVFARKRRAHPSVQRVFDGEAEAKLIALACSEPPEGHARWTIRLLAEKVVELEIVEAVHFNTVGRTLKKTNLNRTVAGIGSFRRLRMLPLSRPWSRCWRSINGPATPNARWSAWTRRPSNW